MKFTTQLLAFVTLAIAASSVIAEAPVYRREALPNGISLPQAGVHRRTDLLRRELIDEYFTEHPEKRAELADESIDDAAVEKREASPEPKQKKKKGNGKHKKNKKPTSPKPKHKEEEEDCIVVNGKAKVSAKDTGNGGWKRSETDAVTDAMEERTPSIEDSQPINDEMVKRDEAELVEKDLVEIEALGKEVELDEEDGLEIEHEEHDDVESRGLKAKKCRNGKHCKKNTGRKHKKHNRHRNKSYHPHSVAVNAKAIGDDDDGDKNGKVSGTVKTHVKVSSNVNGKKSSSEWSPTKKIGSGGGLIGVGSIRTDCNCKNPDASDRFPNGNPNFLACGISKNNPHSGWCAPHVEMSQLKMISVDEAANSPVFAPCKKYKKEFSAASRVTGIPEVVLMSFAMQESSCDAKCLGGNGEMSLMQLTKELCQHDDCWNPAVNIRIGAEYFKKELDSAGGNFLKAAAAYNGWYDKLSYAKATEPMHTNCHAQQNLDYLNQFVNGWLLAVDSYSSSSKYLQIFGNLAKCSD